LRQPLPHKAGDENQPTTGDRRFRLKGAEIYDLPDVWNVPDFPLLTVHSRDGLSVRRTAERSVPSKASTILNLLVEFRDFLAMQAMDTLRLDHLIG
jgi:hypothetical protein